MVLCCSRQVAIIRRSSLACSRHKRRSATLCQQPFGQVNRLPVTIEWLSDNGSCYVAGDTRSFARDIGLEPRTTPIESPQSNGMAEAFVRTIKRDYVRVSPRPDAETTTDNFCPSSRIWCIGNTRTFKLAKKGLRFKKILNL